MPSRMLPLMPVPDLPLSSSNTCADRHKVQVAIDELLEQTYVLETDIAEMQSALSCRASALAQRRQIIASQRNLVLPFHSLSTEILLEIFAFHSLSYRDMRPYGGESMPWLGPLPLTQVCQLWRRLADDYAVLWTFILFDTRRITCSLAYAPKSLERWLGLTKTLPLDLVIYTSEPEKNYLGSDESLLRDLRRAGELLVEAEARWRTLRFPSIQVKLPDYIPKPSSLPNLKQVFLKTIDLKTDEFLSLLPFVKNAPNLTKFTLFSNTDLHPPIIFLQKPNFLAPKLMELNLNNRVFKMNELQALLESQPCLSILKVHGLDFSEDFLSSKRVVHSSLSFLKFRRIIPGRLGGIILPTLKKCELSTAYECSTHEYLSHLLETSPVLANFQISKDISQCRPPLPAPFVFPHPISTLAISMVLDKKSDDITRVWIDSLPEFLQQPSLRSISKPVLLDIISDKHGCDLINALFKVARRYYEGSLGPPLKIEIKSRLDLPKFFGQIGVLKEAEKSWCKVKFFKEKVRGHSHRHARERVIFLISPSLKATS
ncbi:hypothetical protein DL96DRAFT_1811816 [Flagelloscypha sp. PMI_526]|nr:hypothetical protein DL96DRAFT_1811816 [Flagelloscypha sp. PMI_526]